MGLSQLLTKLATKSAIHVLYLEHQKCCEKLVGINVQFKFVIDVIRTSIGIMSNLSKKVNIEHSSYTYVNMCMAANNDQEKVWKWRLTVHQSSRFIS